jgi:hypothetical protein
VGRPVRDADRDAWLSAPRAPRSTRFNRAPDAAADKIDADPGFLQRVGGLSDLFVRGSGNRSTLVRIGRG